MIEYAKSPQGPFRVPQFNAQSRVDLGCLALLSHSPVAPSTRLLGALHHRSQPVGRRGLAVATWWAIQKVVDGTPTRRTSARICETYLAAGNAPQGIAAIGRFGRTFQLCPQRVVRPQSRAHDRGVRCRSLRSQRRMESRETGQANRHETHLRHARGASTFSREDSFRRGKTSRNRVYRSRLQVQRPGSGRDRPGGLHLLSFELRRAHLPGGRRAC